MKVPETRDELYLEFRRLGYRTTLEVYGAGHLLQRFTVDDIVWTAWHAHEVGERTVYYRKKRLRALLCSTT